MKNLNEKTREEKIQELFNNTLKSMLFLEKDDLHSIIITIFQSEMNHLVLTLPMPILDINKIDTDKIKEMSRNESIKYIKYYLFDFLAEKKMSDILYITNNIKNKISENDYKIINS